MEKPPDKPKSKRRAGIRGLSREDIALWRYVTDRLHLLPGRTIVEPDETELPAPRPKGAKSRKPTATPALPQMPAPARKLPEIGHGDITGVDKRTAQRMRRGQLPIEGRIDLHGLTQEEAHRALSAFLAGAQRSGRRCVLVVTGKGRKPDGGTGVLRANVPHWLNTLPNRGRILAFSYATPKDGGEGALYVLLRRAK